MNQQYAVERYNYLEFETLCMKKLSENFAMKTLSTG
jgi:hypothetical protein